MPPTIYSSFTSDSLREHNRGEWEVYQALRAQLPDDWFIFHHYTYSIRQQNWRAIHGEADFVVVAPGIGVAILEVKSSQACKSVGRQWFRVLGDGREQPTDNPFDQARSNMYNIVSDIISNQMRVGRFPGSFTHLVVYPRGRLVGALAPAYLPEQLVTAPNMRELKRRILDAFVVDGWVPAGPPYFGPAQCRQTVQILKGDMTFVSMAGAADAEDDTSKIEALTREQFDTYRDMLARNRVRIAGCAGSGKTMIAIWTACSLASLGDKVLFLCFNRLLSGWIRLKYEVPEGVHVYRYHQLCSNYARRASLPFTPPDQRDDSQAAKDFWATQTPQILLDAILELDEDAKFDSIIIDEAQDFHADWWAPLELLLRDQNRGHFVLFHDNNQNIAGEYGTPAYPAAFNSQFTLSYNCRNTQRITRYCGRVLQELVEEPNLPTPFIRSPAGNPPELKVWNSDAAHRANIVRDTVNAWLAQGFKPGQIAILSPWNKDNSNSSLRRLDSIGSHPVRDDLANLRGWVDDQCFFGTTIRAFKGLEADCVVLTDLPVPDQDGFRGSDLYVAASRAKVHLAMVPASPEAHRRISNLLASQSSPD